MFKKFFFRRTELDVNELQATPLNVHLDIQLRSLLELHRQAVVNPSPMSSFPQPELDSKSLLVVMLVAVDLLPLQLLVNAVTAPPEPVEKLLIDHPD